MSTCKPPPSYHRKPSWIQMSTVNSDRFNSVKKDLNINKLNTVCQEAKCPNINECWSQGTATIMILGDTCTRGCRFCNIKTGNPNGIVDEEEPQRVSEQVLASHLKYVVITCVDRDDLEDGGAKIFADTITLIKKKSSLIKIESLIGDYQGSYDSLMTLLASNPDVISHNLETVEPLTPMVRDRRATYRNSLQLLERIKSKDPKKITKSSLMVGLGETKEELYQTCIDLRNVGVDIITFGQYLRPTMKHLAVKRYYSIEEFKALEIMARDCGFKFVASGPMVRSSYRAAELFLLGHLQKQET